MPEVDETFEHRTHEHIGSIKCQLEPSGRHVVRFAAYVGPVVVIVWTIGGRDGLLMIYVQ